MKTLKKDRSLFPFSFVYKSRKQPQDELPTHMHDFHEIVYIHNGEGSFFIDNTLYEMNQGDLFLIPNDTIHHAVPNKHDLVTSSVIFFSPALIQTLPIEENFSYLSIMKNIKRNKHYKMSLSLSQQQIIEDYLSNMEKESTDKQHGAIHACLLITHQILLTLSRWSIDFFSNTDADQGFNRFWLNDIFNYIEQHIHDDLSLTLLAQKAHVSTAHFSRVFKEVTGMKFTIYLNKKRTFRAKELLRKTNYPVAYIAELSGYESTPHFYRTFKQYTGKTPAQYRREWME